MSDLEIQCPHCQWQPDGGAYWQCECGHVWNTFETAARCPGCKKQHRYTACIPWRGGCDQRAPHLDWYHQLDEWMEEYTETKVVVLT